MGSYYNFKKVQVVPKAMEFIDIVLSKIQRKTATVVHPNYQISRIRQFYMKKVKFGQDCFDEKLDKILSDFPKLDEIHPFYADLMNVLYDRDHYKLALGQISTCKHLIDNVAKDYNRLLKFGDSLFRCKQLKKAALGRMCTIMKRQKDSLAYLEQVRQHLSRLPSIDPNTRTLLICGYPNVGKSSYMNTLTRAAVEVQPYAFTTKSLFVGHLDYKNLRWQVIDTPGILDHPLEDRNTIEMQSITALAHLRACVLFFMDISETCGYTIAQQVSLFESISPLFANKPTVVVFNKTDLCKLENLSAPEVALLAPILNNPGIQKCHMSTHDSTGVMECKQLACDILLSQRVEMKLKGSRIGEVLQKLHVAVPVSRDARERPPHVPEAVHTRAAYDKSDPNRKKLEVDLENENGGAGVYNIDLKKFYTLEDDAWKYDYIPEIMDGKNVADFFDEDIENKLKELEVEEERLEAEGFYADEIEIAGSDEELLFEAASVVEKRKQLLMRESRMKKGKHRPLVKLLKNTTLGDMKMKLKERGIELNTESVRSRSTARKRARSASAAPSESLAREQSMSAKRFKSSAPRDRTLLGLRNEKQKTESEKVLRYAQRPRNLQAKASESDRSIPTKMPKHLFSGKRGNGSASHRSRELDDEAPVIVDLNSPFGTEEELKFETLEKDKIEESKKDKIEESTADVSDFKSAVKKSRSGVIIGRARKKR